MIRAAKEDRLRPLTQEGVTGPTELLIKSRTRQSAGGAWCVDRIHKGIQIVSNVVPDRSGALGKQLTTDHTVWLLIRPCLWINSLLDTSPRRGTRPHSTNRLPGQVVRERGGITLSDRLVLTADGSRKAPELLSSAFLALRAIVLSNDLPPNCAVVQSLLIVIEDEVFRESRDHGVDESEEELVCELELPRELSPDLPNTVEELDEDGGVLLRIVSTAPLAKHVTERVEVFADQALESCQERFRGGEGGTRPSMVR
jgi:hypothetical protein